ncbi:membrane-bound lytic murein transglycosylase [Neoasaia chiangmaiensis NBRC 101099]|nr:MltA domain-containing protein [Neoasaia chiangmaiensis]GBR38163.1 membrane-bound lytic murein transglycosylase [Neoasaia chiangmaiensis NBRC 101099]GEN16011.1 murein transglycosylase [Neoasaia chiangmaiensis]
MKFSPLRALPLGMLLVAGCAEQPSSNETLSLTPVAYEALTGWSGAEALSVLSSLRAECRRFATLPPQTHLGGSAPTIPNGSRAGDWAGACGVLATTPDDASSAQRYLQAWFVPYRVEQDAFYSGYYEPQVFGSPTRQGAFQTPLYARPTDLVRARTTAGSWVSGRWQDGRFSPHFSRAEIDQGALAGKGLELAWLRSPEDLFFLQIQGSGRIVMPDGSVMRVGYSGRNGHPYTPIGHVLVENGDLAAHDVTMVNIRNWLAAHPDQARSILEKNANYVFFKRLEGLDAASGAPGALGIGLTPGRSIAIDRNVMPLGVPVWVETRLPDAQGQVGDWRHLVLAQDIGTDIAGPGRADLFTGWGPAAEAVAGGLRESGTMTVLLPRPPA